MPLSQGGRAAMRLTADQYTRVQISPLALWRCISMSSLEVKDLQVSVDGKEILRGVNLTVEEGRVHQDKGKDKRTKNARDNRGVKIVV